MPLIRVGYKQIHYRDVAPKDDQTPRGTIVLVHGLGSTQNYYAGVIPGLVNHGYRCIALDTTGSGRSPYTYVEQSLSSLAEDIIGAMDALNISKAVLVAHSMGGLTGPQAAALAPSRVSALVLLGPVYPSEQSAPAFEQRIAAVERNGIEAMGDTVPYAAVGPKATVLHIAFIRELIMGTDPRGYISLCRVIADAYKSPPAYSKVVCPLFIIAGEEDKSAPLAGCEKVLGAVGSERKEMTVMQSMGHWMAVEAPEEVATLMIGFLEPSS